ncbi:catechol 2,3-dioxygenase-like lactoylglutathione lyase family enzyme [Mycolicibacterium moriokaense]|uniref:Catechol 2,3-dioxygenase-like lactoylglutathione lyase family enzyme n=2 Tax=Mycolicibacterium moriokaense TaxID=39691 RepID=A0A318HA07_9MYCO|nr:catechol 2,3-dioxygenase-like lactoylglutathione lyase family enzyme [Mycolicibacterium moriokaense]
MNATKTYDVGGVRMARPFKIRRFGHFGFNLDQLDEAVPFYTDELGFRITDDMNLFDMLDGGMLAHARTVVTNPRMLFTSNSSDHHAVLLAHKTFGTLIGNDAIAKDNTVSQITWQVGTLDEVLDGAEYLTANDVQMVRLGRDMPGGNWHAYFLDPDGNTLELYYGMEQIGWDRNSKPHAMHYRGFDSAPPRPQMSEAAEIREALSRGIDIHSGSRPSESHLEEKFNVGGVLLARPFKIVGLGPFSLFTHHLDTMAEFYTTIMGFQVTEEATCAGRRVVYLRHGTEHHSMVLLDKALRTDLGLRPDASCLSVGMQVGSYHQLLDAVEFLEARGREIVELPSELHLGIDYAAHVRDPEGHLIELYYSMEQVGWDGRPRPASQRPTITTPWPDSVDAQSDSYIGQTYLGPLG